MAQKLEGGLPEGMDLEAQYTIQWSALDPATGAPVAGVVVSNAGMLVTLVGSSVASALAVGPFMLVPGPGA